MRQIKKTTSFKKDFKRSLKRGLPVAVLAEVLELLATDSPLPERCRPHKLVGEYTGTWECHIAPDWLLIYEYEDGLLNLRRMGSHSDLFK
ncbi:MAG: type II toxin-antitoxin system YafQ family toxin [Hyphomicrobiales bacterium]|uniref:type II toxin-antitoxin system YafQ family toxin n=1 Tax=Roseobacteraceae TaxID=2854170 RepID=UPI003271229E